MLGGRNSEMMAAMLNYMPLRALVMFSEGAVNRAQVEEIVEKLNNS
jgi:beta-glucosidase